MAALCEYLAKYSMTPFGPAKLDLVNTTHLKRYSLEINSDGMSSPCSSMLALN